jgi:DNA-binding transcriptional regulator/RsmH inhibitor MraZ
VKVVDIIKYNNYPIEIFYTWHGFCIRNIDTYLYLCPDEQWHKVDGNFSNFYFVDKKEAEEMIRVFYREIRV